MQVDATKHLCGSPLHFGIAADSGSRRVVESALKKAGLKLKSFKKVMELDSTEAIKSAAEVGLGVGFVSRWTVTNELELGLLKITPVDSVRVTRHSTLISRTGPEPESLVEAFRAFTLKRAAHISKIRKKTNPRSWFLPITQPYQ